MFMEVKEMSDVKMTKGFVKYVVGGAMLLIGFYMTMKGSEEVDIGRGKLERDIEILNRLGDNPGLTIAELYHMDERE